MVYNGYITFYLIRNIATTTRFHQSNELPVSPNKFVTKRICTWLMTNPIKLREYSHLYVTR